jgi:hypothetical protein
MGDPPSGGEPDDQPGHDKKNPADQIRQWIAVIGGATKIVTDILEWFR